MRSNGVVQGFSFLKLLGLVAMSMCVTSGGLRCKSRIEAWMRELTGMLRGGAGNPLPVAVLEQGKPDYRLWTA